MQKTNKAFTLVELIVVITILAILGTIAFISLGGYSKTARNSKRTSDIGNIKMSLELFSLNTGYYPTPDNGEEVLYDNDLLWTQGTVGSNVTTNLGKNLQKKPTDPLHNIEYIYSLASSKKEYEVMSVYEGNLVNNSLINSTFASDKYSIKVEGNYNEIFIKTSNNVFPTPSLITSATLPLDFNLEPSAIESQVITDGDNFPDLNIPNTEVQTGGLNVKLSVYTGSITKISNDTEKKKLADKILGAYEGTTLASTTIYKGLLEKTTNTELVEMVNDIVFNKDNSDTKVTIVNNCSSQTITGETYSGITYNFSTVSDGDTVTGTGETTTTNGTATYSATVSCSDLVLSISGETETINCDSSYVDNGAGGCILETVTRTAAEYTGIRMDGGGGGMLAAKCPTGYYIKTVSAYYQMGSTRNWNWPVMHTLDLWNSSNSRLSSNIGVFDYSSGTNRSNYRSQGYSSYKRNIYLANNTNTDATIVSYDIGSYGGNNRTNGRNVNVRSWTPGTFSYDTHSSGIIKGGSTTTSSWNWTTGDKIKMDITCTFNG